MNHTASGEEIVYLLTGSNLGNRLAHMEKAHALLAAKAGRMIVSSSVYETEPWGFSHRNSFYNQALGLITRQKPHELLQTLLIIEKELGRIRKPGKYQARTMDIDILLYGNAVIRQPDLVIPHPRIQDRRFALAPLAEIAPDQIHPVLGLSIRQLLKECSDMGWIRKLD
jgi:2-amino-4-hydroxy-6-hydroxymethyldihydropteridine diphosphokinase